MPEEEERKFKSVKDLDIADLKRVGLPYKDLAHVHEDWDKGIKFLNALLISGPKVTDSIKLDKFNEYMLKIAEEQGFL